MRTYSLSEEDIAHSSLLHGKLAMGAFILSEQHNQPLPAGVDVNAANIAETIESMGHREPYIEFSISKEKIRNSLLTEQDARNVAGALAETTITSVIIRGNCFTDNKFIVDFVNNLPNTINNLIINEGGLSIAVARDFIAAVKAQSISTVNLVNNTLSDKIILELLDEIGPPIVRLFLAGNNISPRVRSIVVTTLDNKGIAVSFGSEIVERNEAAVTTAAIARLRLGIDSEHYAYTRLLAIALLRSNGVVQQAMLDEVESARQGDVGTFTHPLSRQVDNILNERLKLCFSLPKKAYVVAEICKQTQGAAINPGVMQAVKIAVFAVTNNGIPCSLDVLTSAKESVMQFEQEREQERLQNKAQRNTVAPLPVSSSPDQQREQSRPLNANQRLLEDAVTARRALLFAKGKPIAFIEKALGTHSYTCASLIRRGRAAQVSAYMEGDKMARAALGS